MATFTRQYRPSALDDVEEIENYCPGGFHPINIEDEIEGRYKVVHKLGNGGFSAVWLARDKLAERYVALKIIVASIRQDFQRARGSPDITEGNYLLSWAKQCCLSSGQLHD